MNFIKIIFVLTSGFQVLSAHAETVTYYVNDLVGSPVAAMDSSGAVIWRESYNPFGRGRIKPSQNTNDVGYTGHQKDDATGLTYMQARYYDPTIGRFYGVDPVGFSNVHNFNRFAYANNNPYKYVDPDGEWAQLVIRAFTWVRDLYKVYKLRKKAAKGYSAYIQANIIKQASIIAYQDSGHSGSNNHEVPGGLIGAIVNETITGKATKGKYHGKKGMTVLSQLNKLAKKVKQKGSPLNKKQKKMLLNKINLLRKPLKKAVDAYKKSPLVPKSQK